MIAIGDPASVPAGQYAEEGALGAWSYVEKRKLWHECNRSP